MGRVKTNTTIRILVADDHFVVRVGLVSLIRTEPGLEVIAEAADGHQAVQAYNQFRPDLVLMDLRMPVKDGIQASAEIHQLFPQARILMLTTFDGDDDIHKALAAGALGYLLKGSTAEALIEAIRTVAAGKPWIPQEITARLEFRNRFKRLTLRELQILNRLAQGLANKQIAAALAISIYTVKDHLKAILDKLRVADRTEAVTVALQRGIIRLERCPNLHPVRKHCQLSFALPSGPRNSEQMTR